MTITRTIDRNIPKTALRLRATVEPLANPGTDPGTDPETIPFRLVARTGDAIEHPFWGRIAHDIAGMILTKPRLPVDYAHDPNQIIGFAENFREDGGNLVCDGALVSAGNDRAAEIARNIRAGIPYEASIAFDPNGGVIEEVQSNATADANGRQIAGPATIFRKWTLRNVAICPLGADPGTRAELDTQFCRLSQTGALPMQPPEHQPTREPPAERPEIAELKRYMETFGAKDGAELYAAGTPFDRALQDAATRYRSALDTAQAANRDHAARIAELETELAEARAEKTRLAAEIAKLTAALPRGEPEPVSDGQTPPTNPSRPLRPLERFARAIKLPRA